MDQLSSSNPGQAIRQGFNDLMTINAGCANEGENEEEWG